MIKYHIERIKCPECGKIQPAKVVHCFPFNIYSHCCKNAAISLWKANGIKPTKEL